MKTTKNPKVTYVVEPIITWPGPRRRIGYAIVRVQGDERRAIAAIYTSTCDSDADALATAERSVRGFQRGNQHRKRTQRRRSDYMDPTVAWASSRRGTFAIRPLVDLAPAKCRRSIWHIFKRVGGKPVGLLATEKADINRFTFVVPGWERGMPPAWGVALREASRAKPSSKFTCGALIHPREAPPDWFRLVCGIPIVGKPQPAIIFDQESMKLESHQWWRKELSK